jgi:hypothetical protein
MIISEETIQRIIEKTKQKLQFTRYLDVEIEDIVRVSFELLKQEVKE